MKISLLSLWIVFTGVLQGIAQDNPFGMKGVKPESAYTFSSSLTYKMTTSRKGKSTWMTTQYYFMPKATTVGIKFLDSSEGDKSTAGIDFMVMDISQARMFTFMGESKMVIGMGMKPDKFNEMVEKENASISVTKTAETKTIMGHECEGYSVKNDKDKSDVVMWVSKKRVESLADLGTQMAKAFAGSGKGGPNNYFAYNAHPELAKIAREGRGILGYTSKSDKGEITDLELTGIDPKINYTFKASDYKSMF